MKSITFSSSQDFTQAAFNRVAELVSQNGQSATALMTNKTNQKKPVQKTTQTRKNTVESPKSAQFYSAESSRLTDFSTPIYNMRVTID